MDYNHEIEQQKSRIKKIRENVDLLTNNVVTHLNEINRILTEIEQILFKHPPIEEALFIDVENRI
ncbi:MAG: hypothetical protein WC325_06725 [Candidatus Bathyarchaeia archaeon]|jgi:N-glycosylase/DNA lyase